MQANSHDDTRIIPKREAVAVTKSQPGSSVGTWTTGIKLKNIAGHGERHTHFGAAWLSTLTHST